MIRELRAFYRINFSIFLLNTASHSRFSPLLLAGLLWLGSLGSTAPGQTLWPDDMTEEQRYWHKVQQEKAAENQRTTAAENARRETVVQSLEALEAAGRALQQQIIIATDGPPVIEKPSWFADKGRQIALCIAGVLFIFFVKITWERCRHEAEARELSGGYLSDGTEIAKFKMPELFNPTPPAPVPVPHWLEATGKGETPARDPREAFFSSFPEYLAQMRDALQELGRTNDPAQKQKILGDMAELIGAFKIEANLWQLRPIMQVSTVLELLLQRLVEKTKEITPSAVRTIAGALDLLADLAVPDLRPDLLVLPPLKILAVDDEPLCQRALTFALEKAGLTPDLASDGAEAVALAKENVYDVVFMDIQMPVMDGFTACQQIHETFKNGTTPVVFVTVQSDFQTRAQSTVIGGTDFMAKPFLIFELTVKAMAYAARKRLRRIAAAERPGLLTSPPVRATAPASTPALTSKEAKSAERAQEKLVVTR